MCLIWDKRDGEQFEPMQELESHRDSYVLKCQFNHTGEFLATCSSDKTCSVWQLNDVEEEDKEGEEYQEYAQHSILSGHGGWVWDCDFTMDDHFLITVSTDAKARIWRMGREEIR
jgi:G protein beta subunit-like protein